MHRTFQVQYTRPMPPFSGSFLEAEPRARFSYGFVAARLYSCFCWHRWPVGCYSISFSHWFFFTEMDELDDHLVLGNCVGYCGRPGLLADQFSGRRSGRRNDRLRPLQCPAEPTGLCAPGDEPRRPDWVGIVVGFSFRRELLQEGLPILIWGVIGAFVFLLVGLLLSVVAARLGYLHFNTAIFGFSPGGFTNMAVMAGDEGAEAAPVALIHFVRVVLLFIVVPLMVRLLTR